MSKTVRVSERTYERIKANQREGETTAETLDRLVRGRPLTAFAGTLGTVDASHARETIAAADEAATRESDATARRALEVGDPDGDDEREA